MGEHAQSLGNLIDLRRFQGGDGSCSSRHSEGTSEILRARPLGILRLRRVLVSGDLRRLNLEPDAGAWAVGGAATSGCGSGRGRFVSLVREPSRAVRLRGLPYPIGRILLIQRVVLLFGPDFLASSRDNGAVVSSALPCCSAPIS